MEVLPYRRGPIMNSLPPFSMVCTTSATSASRSTISSTPSSLPNSKGFFIAHNGIIHKCMAHIDAIRLGRRCCPSGDAESQRDSSPGNPYWLTESLQSSQLDHAQFCKALIRRLQLLPEPPS